MVKICSKKSLKVILTSTRWVIKTDDIKLVLGTASVEGQMELAKCTWLTRARNEHVLLTSLDLDSHGDLMKHLGRGLVQRGRGAIGGDSILALGQLKDEKHR